MFQTAGVPKGKIVLGGGTIRRREDVDPKAREVLERIARSRGDEMGEILECMTYGMGSSISIIVGRYEHAGWCLIVTHTKRVPSWDEIAYARYRLVPHDINLAIPFPAVERRIPLHDNSVHLWEVEPKRAPSRLVGIHQPGVVRGARIE